MSMSAFSTFQHGSASSFSQPFEQRWSLIAIALGVSRGEERELRLALAAEHLQVDRRAADATRLRERDRLRLDLLRRKDPATARFRRVLADEGEVARQLLDRLDRPDALDLDGDPLPICVLAHEIDGADLRRPLALHERERLAERVGSIGEGEL